MKKISIDPEVIETVIRFIIGILLILTGIVVFMLHFAKVVPNGWETSPILGAITFVWAYAGPFIAAILVMSGLYLMGIVDKIMEKAGLN